MIYIVLGMHKSGTTVLAKTLHQSGITMVEDSREDVSYDEGNQFERESTKNINKQMMNCFGKHSLRVTSRSLPNDIRGVHEQMKEVINSCQEHSSNWGFKDPRTCLTYPIWKEVLPPHKLIMVYRNPCQIAKHYSRVVDIPWRIYNALNTWEEYNKAILRIFEQSDVPCLLLDFEDYISKNETQINLRDFLDVQIQDARDTRQYRHRTVKSNYYTLFNKMKLTDSDKLYKKLKQLSEKNPANVKESI